MSDYISEMNEQEPNWDQWEPFGHCDHCDKDLVTEGAYDAHFKQYPGHYMVVYR